MCKHCGKGSVEIRNLCAKCAHDEFRTLMECAALRKSAQLAARAYRGGLVSARFALALRQALQHLESVVNSQAVCQ
jgi:hypothetical protein